MRQTDALPGFVLGSCAPEKIEDALMILRVDTAPIVRNVENHEPQLVAAADGDIAGNARLEILQGIFNEIGEDLFQREPVGDVWDSGHEHDVDGYVCEGCAALERDREKKHEPGWKAFVVGAIDKARTRFGPGA